MTAFDKYEGLGNDFVVVEADDQAALDASEAVRLCDRHFGIGADGVLLVTPPSSAEARARMVVLNADGSRPEMCGNGLRCVALHLARRDAATGTSYIIDTDAGPLLCEVERDGDAAMVTVGMGRGRPEGEHESGFASDQVRFARVSMGNPHAIVFDSGFDEAAVDRLGPQVSGELSGGSNVEFATHAPRRGVRSRGLGARAWGAHSPAARAPPPRPLRLRFPVARRTIRQ